MLIPIRCFTCGALIADKWDEYKSRVENGEEPGAVLDSLNVKRYCCRRMFLTHYEVFDEIVKFRTLYGYRESRD